MFTKAEIGAVGAHLIVPEKPSGPPAFDIEFDTPCGKKVQHVTSRIYDDSEGRMVVTIKVLEPPERSEVWFDLANSAPVQIGQLELVMPTDFAGRPQSSVHGLACAPSHEVRLAGQVIGTVDGTSADSILISDQPDACYDFKSIRYGETWMGGTSVMLDGKQVNRFIGSVDHFLEEAPETIQVSGTSGVKGMGKTQLLRVPCPNPPTPSDTTPTPK